jgi:hypothetical protein
MARAEEAAKGEEEETAAASSAKLETLEDEQVCVWRASVSQRGPALQDKCDASYSSIAGYLCTFLGSMQALGSNDCNSWPCLVTSTEHSCNCRQSTRAARNNSNIREEGWHGG